MLKFGQPGQPNLSIPFGMSNGTVASMIKGGLAELITKSVLIELSSAALFTVSR